jgi:Zn-dependent metalloprotease
MNKRKKQTDAKRSADGDDFRTRYDGIEHAGDQQIEALRQLDMESKTTTSGVVRRGQLTALQGRFPAGTTDPIKAAIGFLEKHAAAFGFDINGKDDAFATPQLVKCDEGLPRDIDTVVFGHRVRGVPTYRGGVAIGVDRGGSVRFARALVLPPIKVAKGRDAAGARKVVAALLREGELPEPTFELFDPALVLGETGKPVGVWVFDVPGEAPIHVLVEDGGDEVFRIITNPGCPAGALPTYHLNRVTLAPDMVLFPGAGLMLPEASTRSPIAVARALFERFPKLFGTGDPASQLAVADVLTGPDPQIPTTTVVFHQRWGALPVFGCQLRVHLSKALAVRSISGNFLRDPNVPTTPTVSESAARITASTTAAFDLPVRLDQTHYAPLAQRAIRPVAGEHPAISSERANLAEVSPSHDDGIRHGASSGAGAEWAEEGVPGVDRSQSAGGDYTPGFTDRDARADALRLAANFHSALKLEPERAVTIGASGTEDRGLVILPTSLTRSGHEQNHLAWWFRFGDADRFISATTGALVLTLSRVQSAERVFDAANETNPPVGVNLQFLDGIPQVPAANLDPDSQTAAGAVANVAAFWRIFRRDSWDGRGADMDAYVDWQFPPNDVGVRALAQWQDKNRSVYTPQNAVPDIVGHEFTHGLTQATAGLVYLDESGAANEHYSDLFGNLIFPDVPSTSWRVGERSPTGGRDMRNPTVGTYQNYRVMPPDKANDFGGVHINSGILSRAAVLMCDGNPPVRPTGIGRSRLAKLAWETLVFRLHPFASFSDVMHLTWAVSRELADAGALGAPGIAGDTGPGVAGQPPAFDAAVTDTVVWAFQQVGLVLDVQSGWYDVTAKTRFEIMPGVPGFFADETLYRGQSLTNGRTLTDMQVRLFQQRLSNPAMVIVSGSMSVNTGGVFTAPNGSFSARITAPTGPIPAGTTSLETTVRITSPTAVRVFLAGVPTIAESQEIIPPPVTPMDTPRVAHWLDFVPFGRTYEDILYEGAQLPVGCFLTNVELRVIGMLGGFGEGVIIPPGGGGDGTYLIASTTNVGVNVGDNHQGAHIVSRALGGRSLQVKVHSWHDAWVAVRYKLRYSVAGNACSLPPFTIRELEL